MLSTLSHPPHRVPQGSASDLTNTGMIPAKAATHVKMLSEPRRKGTVSPLGDFIESCLPHSVVAKNKTKTKHRRYAKVRKYARGEPFQRVDVCCPIESMFRLLSSAVFLGGVYRGGANTYFNSSRTVSARLNPVSVFRFQLYRCRHPQEELHMRVCFIASFVGRRRLLISCFMPTAFLLRLLHHCSSLKFC